MIDSEFYVWVSADGFSLVCDEATLYKGRVSLSGGSATLARDWFSWFSRQSNFYGDVFPDAPYDTAGVLADRMEEYPHEAEGMSHYVQLFVRYLRMQFTERTNPFRGIPHHQR